MSSGTPPACPQQPMLATPVDLSLATSILYPGQVRGNAFKPHGGLRDVGVSEISCNQRLFDYGSRNKIATQSEICSPVKLDLLASVKPTWAAANAVFAVSNSAVLVPSSTSAFTPTMFF